MAVTISDIRSAVRGLGVDNRPMCIHSSLRSFGWVQEGAATVVDGFLAEGCTVMVPTFSESFGSAAPPPGRRPQRNREGDVEASPLANNTAWRFSTISLDLDPEMGAIPAEVLRRPSHLRGDHPRDSFSAVGPLANHLISGQRPLEVYAPFRTLVVHDGVVILMGVGLDRLTFLHYAEQLAGRRLFRHWTIGAAGQTVESEDGGCSSGFENLKEVLAPFERHAHVGGSFWRVFPVGASLDAATRAIRANPSITHCDNPSCGACDDAISGGPLFPDAS